MTDKELQRLTRSELLELLIKQTEEKKSLGPDWSRPKRS